MTVKEMIEKFDEFSESFDKSMEFDAIENPLHPAKDICGLLMLAALLPGARYGIAGADHDVIYLEADVDKLAKVATPEIIRDLVRCGIVWSDEYDSLIKFV